jgi:hypothetical protein
LDAHADAEFRLKATEYYYIVSQFGDVAVRTYGFETPYELRCVLFEVAYASWQAQRRHGFRHGDLHTGNVLLVRRGPRTYRVGATHFEVSFLYQPLIIDFDQSSFGAATADDAEDAMCFISDVFYSVSRKTKPVRDFMQQELKPLLDTRASLTSLLGSELFYELRSTKPSPTKSARVDCHICGGPATTTLKREPSFAFCGTQCVEQLGSMGHLL